MASPAASTLRRFLDCKKGEGLSPQIELVDDGESQLNLRVGQLQLSVIVGTHEDPPLLFGEGSAAADLAYQVNERLERKRRPQFEDVLELLLEAHSTKRFRQAGGPPEGSGAGSSGLHRDGTRGEDYDSDAGGGSGGQDDEDADEPAEDDDDDDDEDDDDDDDDDDDFGYGGSQAGGSAGESEAGEKTPPNRGPGAAEAFTLLQRSTGGRAVSLSRRMQSDLLEVMRSDLSARGIVVELAQEDRLDVWRVKFTSFSEGSQLAADLATLSALAEPGAPPACVEVEMKLPPDYPFSPPAVRVVRPRFRANTGYVIHGAICMELLTPQGWMATFSIEAILEQLRAHLVIGKGALDLPAELVQRPTAATNPGPNLELNAAPPDEPADGASADDAPLVAADRRAGGVRLAAGRVAPAGEEAGPGGEGGEAKGGNGGADGGGGGAVADARARAAALRALNSGYSPEEATRAFTHIVKFHKERGWAPPASLKS